MMSKILNIYNRIAPFFWVPAKPSHISIAINSVCNAKCIMCDIGQKNKTVFSKKFQKQHKLSIRELRDMLSKIGHVGTIHINGTEPLLHSRFDKIIKLCKRFSNSVHLTTNGFLIPISIRT